MGTLKYKYLKVLQALCDRAQSTLSTLNAQDLSTSVWALGVLHHNPGALMQGICLHAATCVGDFEPKVRSHGLNFGPLLPTRCLPCLESGWSGSGPSS